MKGLKSVLSCALLLVSTFAFAEAPAEPKKEEVKPPYVIQSQYYVGATFGVTAPLGQNVSELETRIGYGAEVGYKLMPNFFVGAFYDRNSGEVMPSTNVDAAISTYGLQAQYYCDVLYGRVRAGSSSISLKYKSLTLDSDAHPFNVGVGAGFDIHANSHLTFSPNAEFTHYFKTDSTGEFGSINYALTVKYFF